LELGIAVINCLLDIDVVNVVISYTNSTVLDKAIWVY